MKSNATVERVSCSNSPTKGVGVLTNTTQRPLLCELPSPNLMKNPVHLGGLEWRELVELQEEHEGTIRFKNITQDFMRQWVNEHAKLLERDELRFEYNFVNQSFAVQCMALPIHESLEDFFVREVLYSLGDKLGRKEAGKMVVVGGSGTTFSGFSGDGLGTSKKQPDSFIQLRKGGFPTIVCETGWAESIEELKQDARLWLLHTNGETKIVIILSFIEKHSKTKLACEASYQGAPSAAGSDKATVTTSNNGPTPFATGSSGARLPTDIRNNSPTLTAAGSGKATILSISNDNPIPSATGSGEATLPQEIRNDGPTPSATGSSETTLPISTIADRRSAVPPVTSDDMEKALIASIKEDMDINELAEKLFILNKQGGLSRPLLGEVGASLHLFKATDEGDDIVQTFFANLLPPEPKATKTPNKFGITLRDILGNLVPMGHDPAYEITFALEDLKEVVESSIPRTTRLRATDRAIKLIEKTVGLSREPTFAQRKRQKLNPIGTWE
ncbi:hypothetical protein B9Z19DRAFT_1067476 [Tuber borchii]|uniref:Uncharacterized protein n=1 Tax=Tuber borchii TaxID=42251 RepID=A0A2T6ZIQ7_TUBBO|nr:hypothetical protein B9Z19DRAFT_1067476 [Tuber borchii]